MNLYNQIQEMNSMRDNNPRRGPGERRDRRFDSKREPRAAAPAPVEEEDETRLEARVS